MEFNVEIINNKREYLHRQIEENSLSLLSAEVISASEELDKLICEYYMYEDSSYKS